MTGGGPHDRELRSTRSTSLRRPANRRAVGVADRPRRRPAPPRQSNTLRTSLTWSLMSTEVAVTPFVHAPGHDDERLPLPRRAHAGDPRCRPARRHRTLRRGIAVRRRRARARQLPDRRRARRPRCPAPTPTRCASASAHRPRALLHVPGGCRGHVLQAPGRGGPRGHHGRRLGQQPAPPDRHRRGAARRRRVSRRADVLRAGGGAPRGPRQRRLRPRPGPGLARPASTTCANAPTASRGAEVSLSRTRDRRSRRSAGTWCRAAWPPRSTATYSRWCE